MIKTRAARPSSATLVNFQDCHAALQELRHAGARTVDFKGLLETDAEIRRNGGLPIDRAIVGFASVDTRSERADAQDRFVRAAQAAGISLEQIDYRDAYVNPTGAADESGPKLKGIQSLAAPISFALGALADREAATLVLFAGSYEHAYGVRQFAARKGRIVIAFWRSCIDQRFFAREVIDAPGISFVDLEQYPAVLGGVDVRVREVESRSSRAGGIGALF
jgi:hypothetical protein